MGAVELVLRQIYPSRLCEVCNRWKDSDATASCIYRFTVNKMILKYQSGRKRTNEAVWKRSERKELRYSKSKPDDFLRAKYEHMMASGLIGFLQILKGFGSGEGRRTTSSSGSLRGGRLRYETCQKISPRRWPVFWRSSVDYRCWLATDS